VSGKRYLRRGLWTIVIVTVLLVFFVRKEEEVSPVKVEARGVSIEITNPLTAAFQGGEELKLRARYLGFIPAGLITMQVEEVNYQGKEAYHLVAEAEASPLFSFFCKFQSVFESYLDARTLSSLRFQEHTRSGRNVDERLTVYDQESGIAETSEAGKPGSRKVKTAKNAQDFLSLLYSLRARELKVGEDFLINLNDRKNNYKVEVKILRTEEVKVPAGRFPAYVAEVKARRVGRDEPGTTWSLWLSEDTRKLPLLIKAGTKIGPMEVSLMDYGRRQK